MKYIVLDTETEAWAPGAISVPAFAAAGFTTGDGNVMLTQDLEHARKILKDAIASGATIVGHNLPFDLEVLGVVPTRTDPVWDTMIWDVLERLAHDDCGEDQPQPPAPRSLESLSGGKMEGKDSVRLSYRAGQRMTPEQERYLHADVVTTQQVFLRQLARGGDWALREMSLQVRARLALSAIEREGLPVDDAEIIKQEKEFQILRREAAQELRKAGVWEPEKIGPRGGKKKEKVLMRAFAAHVEKVLAELGEEPVLTDKGAVKTDKQVLNQLTHDPTVRAWLTYKGCEKLLSTYLKVWKGSGVVHARYRLLMRTGRTSSHSPNLQQVPSRGDKANIKKVFVPPPGRVFFELDYCQLELCTLAYLTQGEMLRRINAGEDLHKYLATVYFGKATDQVTKEERQLMKCANFGLPGGMGPTKFRIFIRQNGLPDPGHEAATALRNAWLAAYPEMTRWLEDPDGEIWERNIRQVWSGKENVMIDDDTREQAWVMAQQRLDDLGSRVPHWVRKRMVKPFAEGTGAPWIENWLVMRRVTVDGGRTRCPVSYTEQHNTKFQGLAANLVKEALALIAFHALGSWKVHTFIHDSVLISVPEDDNAKDLADLVAGLMLDAAKIWMRGVRCGVEISGPGHNWLEAKKAKSWTVFNKG